MGTFGVWLQDEPCGQDTFLQGPHCAPMKQRQGNKQRLAGGTGVYWGESVSFC